MTTLADLSPDERLERMRMAIEPAWRELLASEFDKPYLAELNSFLAAEQQRGVKVLPGRGMTFRAFAETPPDRCRVVIVGQDPYPTLFPDGRQNAMGLSFSVQPGMAIPASLNNIFREQEKDLGIPAAGRSGDLSPWARQGVLLLNSVLTTPAGDAGGHRGKGWEQLTDAALRALTTSRQGLVFLLWGVDAKRKAQTLDLSAHHVLRAVHPAPMAANRGGWFDQHHFSQTNALLERAGQPQVDWRT